MVACLASATDVIVVASVSLSVSIHLSCCTIFVPVLFLLWYATSVIVLLGIFVGGIVVSVVVTYC